MLAFLALYVIIGAALYAPSRESGEAGRGAYYVAFPLHVILFPLLLVLGRGFHGLLRSKGFWTLAFAGVAACVLASGGDPCSSLFAALIVIGVGKLILSGIQELIEA